MATKKPLVVNAGQVQQIQAGDVLDAALTSEVDIFELENENAAALAIGTPVYASSAGKVDEAQADAVGTVEVIGLVQAEIAIAGSGNIQTDGVLTATTGEWDIITGDTGGLTAGDIYYLDPDTAGMLTTTAPTNVGDFVVRVGKGLNTTAMEITILNAVKL